MKLVSRMILLLATSCAQGVFAQTPLSAEEMSLVQSHLLANISTGQHIFQKPYGDVVFTSMPGAVLAASQAPTLHFSQDYFFHWMRDAALTMQATLLIPDVSTDIYKNYVLFEESAQHKISVPNEETLGQPKFNIDSTIWEGDWARPQNDGPAQRAIAFIKIAARLRAQGEQDFVDQHILPAIKTDLDYIASHWQVPTFDLWEEICDTDHFYAKMVQRKSLILGALEMARYNDTVRVRLYDARAQSIEQSLAAHWQPDLGYYTETTHHLSEKGGGLDVSVLLGALHGTLSDTDKWLADEKMQSTVAALRAAFSGIYPINQGHIDGTTLIGRYPSDYYDGDHFNYGNPWVLATNALAEYDYRLALYYTKLGKINVTATNLSFFQQLDHALIAAPTVIAASQPEFSALIAAFIARGDKTLQTVKAYQTTGDDGTRMHFSEQIDKLSGEGVSAPDLSWGYASFITAMEARRKAVSP